MSNKIFLVKKLKPIYGRRRSHANNKSLRKFKLNMQNFRIRSNALKLSFNVKSTPSTIRTIKKYKGLDYFALKMESSKLSDRAIRIKRKILFRLRSSKS